MRSLFFSRCNLCGDPEAASWWVGPDISIAPVFELAPGGDGAAPGSEWTSPDLGSLRFTGYRLGPGLIFRRDGDWLLLDRSRDIPPARGRPTYHPAAARCHDRRPGRPAAAVPA